MVMEIVIKCEMSEERINEILTCEENTMFRTESDIKKCFEIMLEEDIIETLDDNKEVFTNISYEIN